MKPADSLEQANEDLRTIERHIAARHDRIGALSKELSEGEAFVARWAARRAELASEITQNEARLIGLTKTRSAKLREQSQFQKLRTLQNLREQVQRMEREMKYEAEHGAPMPTPIPVSERKPLLLDHYGNHERPVR